MSTRLVCNLFAVPDLTSFEAFLVYSPNTLSKPDGGYGAVCKRLGLLLRNKLRTILEANTSDDICYCAGGDTFQLVQQYQSTLEAIKRNYHRHELSFHLEDTTTQSTTA